LDHFFKTINLNQWDLQFDSHWREFPRDSPLAILAPWVGVWAGFMDLEHIQEGLIETNYHQYLSAKAHSKQ
jgi:hypothetical protein